MTQDEMIKFVEQYEDAAPPEIYSPGGGFAADYVWTECPTFPISHLYSQKEGAKLFDEWRPREKEDGRDRMGDLLKSLSTEEQREPIVVVHWCGEYYLWDGAHRCVTLCKLDRDWVYAIVGWLRGTQDILSIVNVAGAQPEEQQQTLDLIYASIDRAMRHDQWSELDKLFDLPVRHFSDTVLIAVLTASLPAKSKLPSRPEFFRRVELLLRERGEWEEGLLSGLE